MLDFHLALILSVDSHIYNMIYNNVMSMCITFQLVCAVVSHDWRQIVNCCELDNWKEALAVILTYSPPDELSELCGMFLWQHIY